MIPPEHNRGVEDLSSVTIDLGPDVIDNEIAVCGFCQPDKGGYHLFCRADGVDDLDSCVQGEVRRIEVIDHTGNAVIVIRAPDVSAEHRNSPGKDGEGGLEITTGTDLCAGLVAGGDISPDGPFNTFMSAHCGVLG